MRKKISKIVLILIIPAMYFILLSSFAGNNYNAENSLHSGNLLSLSSPVDTPRFVNMIMNMDRKNCKGIWLGNHLDKYRDSLGYNAVQVYPVDDTLYGVFPNTLNDTQKAYNTTLIESVYNKNLKFFYEHVFNSYICYAQRLEYEVPVSNWNNTTNYGFCYQHVNSEMTITTDSGRTVIHSPQTVNHDEVLICDSIYENLQHSDFFGRQHDSTNWYFKPMVRVDTAQFYRLHDTTPIFKIKFFVFDGSELTNYVRIIRKINFLLDTNKYVGNYINKYYIGSSPINIIVPSGLTTGLNTGRGDDLSLCKVDFKIYTYGYADLYFDKLTVDCEYANKLFTNSSGENFDYLIENELEYIGSNSYLYSYYMDEVTNSQIPCIKYFMDKITAFNQQHGTNIKFMVSGSNWMAVNKMRNKALGHKMTLDILQPRIFNGFAYELYEIGNARTYIPANALGTQNIDDRIPVSWYKDNNFYNKYLQDTVLGDRNTSYNIGHDQGTYIYQICLLKHAIENYSTNTMLYFTPQMQGEMWIKNDGSDELTGIREPLNEEIEAQTMAALAHGVQGLLGYIFQSVIIDSNNLYNPISIVYGLYGNQGPRYNNIYGQNKWNFIKGLNSKINKWIPVLDTIIWQSGYSIHSEGDSKEYISGIKSILRNQTGEDSIKYWEIGFFTPNNQIDRSKYFLMVNRRCSPEIQGINDGDLRYLKIKFNSTSLSEFRNWKLEDVYTGESLIFNRLDTTSGGYIDLGNQQRDMGYFLPGEGKLFKLAPVMQEGGTLVCDEYLSSGSINCDSTVYNNGFDITINKDVTISFSSKGEIVMEGGEFKSGLDPQMSQKSLELKNSIFQNTERKFTDFKSFLFFQYLNVKS